MNSGGSSGSGVTQLTAGPNITLTPPIGTGIVQVSASGGGGSGVTQLTAGPNITLTPPTGTGIVQVSASGGNTWVGTATSDLNMNGYVITDNSSTGPEGFYPGVTLLTDVTNSGGIGGFFMGFKPESGPDGRSTYQMPYIAADSEENNLTLSNNPQGVRGIVASASILSNSISLVSLEPSVTADKSGSLSLDAVGGNTLQSVSSMATPWQTTSVNTKLGNVALKANNDTMYVSLDAGSPSTGSIEIFNQVGNIGLRYGNIDNGVFITDIDNGTTGKLTVSGSNLQFNDNNVLTAGSNLDLGGHNILNVGGITMANTTSISNVYNIDFQGGGGLFSNAGNSYWGKPGGTLYFQTQTAFQNSSGTPLDMNSNEIQHARLLSFNNNNSSTAKIDGSYPNQINIDSPLIYLLGNTRFYGSGLTLDLANNTITNVSSIAMNGAIAMNNNSIYNTGELYNNNTELKLTAIGQNIRLNASSGHVYIDGSTGIDINVPASQILSLSTGIGGTIQFVASAISSYASLYINSGNRLYYGLSGDNIQQPIIQRNVATGSGATGTVTVTIPRAYANTSYTIQVTMRDGPAAQLYATPLTTSTFTIGWTSAGAGTQNIMWTTFGDGI
jgi:hypothetical protein